MKYDFQSKFYNLTTRDGLSNNKVLDVFQDQYGFMWFATIDGLNRFDGYTCLVFQNVSGDSTSISGNLVSCITEDAYGDLWIGTHYGLNRYDREKNVFQHFLHEPGNANSLSDNYIRAFCSDDDGNLWIETVDGVLNKYDIQKDKFTHYPHRVGDQFFYHNHVVYEDNEGIIWIGGRSISPHAFDPLTEEFRKFPNNPEGPKEANDVSCFLEDSKGNFWVSGLDGAFQFDKQGTFVEYIQTSTYSIAEDKHSDLWFGTGYGLYHYNRKTKEVVLHTHEQNNPNSLVGPHINKLFFDKAGNLWVATNNGISRYSPGKDKFQHFYHVAGNEKTLSSNLVTSAVEDEDGIIWIGTNGAGLNSFNRKTGEFKSYKYDPADPKSLSSNRVSCLYLDEEKTLWVGLWAGIGFNKFDRETQSFERYVYNTKNTWFDWYNDFLEDSQGNFWVGLWGNHGLYPFDREKGVFPVRDFLPEVIPQDFKINKLQVLKDSILWMGSDDNLISYVDLNKTLRYSYYLPESENQNSDDYERMLQLENNRAEIRSFGEFNEVTDILCDAKGRSWFATDMGLYLHSLVDDDFSLVEGTENLKIQQLFCAPGDDVCFADETRIFQINADAETPMPDQILSGDPILEIIFENGEFWIATPKGLQRYDGEMKKQETVLEFEHPETIVNDLISDMNGNLLLCTNHGLSFLNMDDKTTEKYSFEGNREINTAYADQLGNVWLGTDKGLFQLIYEDAGVSLKNAFETQKYPVNLDNLSVLSIASISDDRLYIGTNKGLIYYYPPTGIMHYIRPNEYNFAAKPVHLVTDLLEDSYGDIWMGTTNTGVCRYKPEVHSLEQFFHYPHRSDSYSGEGATCVFEDSKGNIWVGGNGLNKFNRKSKNFTHITKEDGLPDNNVMGILEDSQHRLWVTTSSGLCCYDPEANTFQTWKASDGLQSNTFSKAQAILKSGEILIGGNNGFNIFHPDSLQESEFVPDIVLTSFKVFEDEIFNDLTRQEKIILDYNQNTVSFEFASLDYSCPDKNEYKYILEGYEKDWVTAQADNRRVKYNNLPQGKYTFKVKATNSDGLWNEDALTLNLIVKPPFWKTIWFYLLEVTLAFVVVLWIVRLRLKKMREKQRTIELEQKLLRSQMNPHFIFNSLNAIQSYIFKKKPIEAGSYLSDFSELVRLILENSRSEYITLAKEIKTLEFYLELQQLRFENKFIYSIEVGTDIDLENMYIPPMLAQPFIENSIEHGFRDLDRLGEIRISFTRNNDFMLFEAEDNGIGLDASLKKKKAKQEKKHKSLATKITRERIQNLNKGRGQQASIEICDLAQLEKQASGTRVVFSLPIKYESDLR